VSAVIYAIGDIHGEKAMLDEMRRRILVDASIARATNLLSTWAVAPSPAAF